MVFPYYSALCNCNADLSSKMWRDIQCIWEYTSSLDLFQWVNVLVVKCLFWSSAILFRVSIHSNDLFKTVLSLNSVLLWSTHVFVFVMEGSDLVLSFSERSKSNWLGIFWLFFIGTFNGIHFGPLFPSVIVSWFFLSVWDSLETDFMASNRMNWAHEISYPIIIFKLLSDESWNEIFLFG